MTSAWLRGQRKPELVELAEKAGLRDPNSLKKGELEQAIDEHLRANQASLVGDKQFHEFYKRIVASPGPPKRDSMPGKEVTLAADAKTPRRRTSKKDDEPKTAGTSTALARTPGASLLPAEMPLPPSPAVIANAIDRKTAEARAKLHELYARSGLTARVEDTRATASTSSTLLLLAVLLELLGLLPELLPFRYVTTIPASSALGTPALALRAPDLFAVLTGDFWSVFATWVITSVLLPLTAGWLFNFTLKARSSSGAGPGSRSRVPPPAVEFDPLTFSVAKALVMYLVYAYDAALLDWPSVDAKLKIEHSVPGGYQGVLIASGIGALASLYEAVLKK